MSKYSLPELIDMVKELEFIEDESIIECPKDIEKFFSLYPDKARIKKISIPKDNENKIFEVGGNVACKTKRWDTGTYKTKHRAEIKEIFLDESYGIFVATVKEKEKEKVHIDLTDEKEIVATLGEKLAKDGDKFWAVSRRDLKTVQDFKIDSENEYSYKRFFDKTKDKPDYFIFFTEEEAEKFTIEKAPCLSLFDIKNEMNKMESDSCKELYEILLDRVVKKANKEKSKKTTTYNNHQQNWNYGGYD